MNFDLIQLRARKLLRSMATPACWPALRRGVAPAIEHLDVLRRLTFDGILDVGANRGQFTLACQLSHPDVPVVAFEPIYDEAAIFREIHGQRQHIRLIDTALGDTNSTAKLHLSQRRDSSSLLPISKLQTALFADTHEVGTIIVSVKRLDEFAKHWLGRSRQLLKLDVQGFELAVLRGAEMTLESCSHVYAECSEVALYEGQALRPEVEKFLSVHGFHPDGRFNEQLSNGKLIQADFLFVRR
jgi:FkbM family methyltransferase